MGAGYNSMNDLVVLQTAQVELVTLVDDQGLAEYLLEVFGEDAKRKGIVIGYSFIFLFYYRYDHRAANEISSKSFFIITAKVFHQKGFKVYGFKDFAFTPLVVFSSSFFPKQPFSTSFYGCCAGIMITASHNPASDDGYKIYWENACQIIPPHDLGISNSIQKNLQPWIDYSTLSLPPIEYIDDQIIPQYMTHAYSCLHLNSDDINKVFFYSFYYLQACPPIMYTAMHGVGAPFIRQIMTTFHLPPVHEVTSQIQPDPTFPTVAFPNPEEKGVSFNK